MCPWHKTVLPPPPVTPGTPVTPARPAAPVGLPFADVSSSDWFYNDVRYVYEKGIMDGSIKVDTAFDANFDLAALRDSVRP